MKRSPAIAVVAALSALTALTAQESSEIPIFRVTTSRALVEFIAIDKDGRIVTDLTRDEIEVRVDGKKQDVDALIPPSESRRSAYVTAAEAASGGTSAAGAGTEETGIGAASRTVILLDTRVLDASNFSHSVRAIRAFVENSLRANSLVMIAEIDLGLKVRQPFTRDKKALLKAVDSLTPSTVFNPLDSSRLLRDLGSSYFDDLSKQVLYLREGLALVCYSMAGLPGRKHVVFFSEGYPINPIRELEMRSRQSTALVGSADVRQQAARSVGSRKDPGVLSMVRDMVALANAFGVSFYTIDARGLVAVSGVGSADISGDVAAGPGDSIADRVAASDIDGGNPESGLSEQEIGVFQLTQISDLADSQNTLLALASGTNGAAFFNTNDLGAVLRASANEQQWAYLASFEPELKGEKKFRRVEVKCKRKDVLIRSQTGFVDFTEGDLLNARLANGFNKPELFGAVKPLIEVYPAKGGGEVVIGVAGADIAARPQDGKYHIEVLFLGQIFDKNGKPVSKDFAVQRGFKLGLEKAQFQSLASQPLLARQPLKLKSGKYQMKLAVFDQVAGTMGVEVASFSVP